jgi:hypothetical protein
MKTSIAAALAAGLLLAATAQAAPAEIDVPHGAKRLLAAAAEGVQIYTCETGGQGFAWVFKAPEAALFDGDGRQSMTHFAGPSWKAEDGTTLVGEVMAKADAHPSPAPSNGSCSGSRAARAPGRSPRPPSSAASTPRAARRPRPVAMPATPAKRRACAIRPSTSSTRRASRAGVAVAWALRGEWRNTRRSSIDQVSLECIRSKVPVEHLRLLQGKDVLLGAIDVASDMIESPEEGAAVIRGALKHVDARRIHPCTNCGMVPMDPQDR